MEFKLLIFTILIVYVFNSKSENNKTIDASQPSHTLASKKELSRQISTRNRQKLSSFPRKDKDLLKKVNVSLELISAAYKDLERLRLRVLVSSIEEKHSIIEKLIDDQYYLNLLEKELVCSMDTFKEQRSKLAKLRKKVFVYKRLNAFYNKTQETFKRICNALKDAEQNKSDLVLEIVERAKTTKKEVMAVYERILHHKSFLDTEINNASAFVPSEVQLEKIEQEKKPVEQKVSLVEPNLNASGEKEASLTERTTKTSTGSYFVEIILLVVCFGTVFSIGYLIK